MNVMIILLEAALAEQPNTTSDTKESPTIHVSAEDRTKALDAFEGVYTVLQHPRCLNCHPSGDAPLQNDDSRPHEMNITRSSIGSGMDCSTCHQLDNSEAYGIFGGPPGAPNWHLPDVDMPLIFEDRTLVELCNQLKSTSENGDKTLEELYNHVAYDPLVLWGWTPGGERTVPPLTHADFASKFKIWIAAGAPCPINIPKPTPEMQ